MNPKDYQEKAVESLLEKGAGLLRRDGIRRMIFHAPTGSGKTLMAAEFLKRLADDNSVAPFACIWTAPRTLHLQSKEKLTKYYADSHALDCVEFDNLTDRQISESQILFVNWESIRQEKNIIIRENERDMYLDKVLENTRETGRKIILLIDESHHHITDISGELIAGIAPNLIVEISATPVLQSPDELIKVQLEDVVAEGMIKKSVVVNQGFVDAVAETTKRKVRLTLAERSEKVVLKQALAKRAQLAAAFADNGVAVNPLMCVQLSDRRSQADQDVEDVIRRVLADNGVTVDNGKLAVWLSDEKANLNRLSENDSEAEVLIFKQAIALGWDCPRAQVLALFRDWKNMVFSVQTLGRIMRMPQPDTGHYASDDLNKAYIYTNLGQVEIHQDVVGGYVHIHTSQRIDAYSALKLRSVHSLRMREKTRVARQFGALFLQVAEEMKLKEKIKTKNQRVSQAFISDLERVDVDAMAGETMVGKDKMQLGHSAELQKMFDHFVRDNLSPYYPEERSIGNAKKAIYDFFGGPLLMDYEDKFENIINIVLSESNRQHFAEAMARAVEKYRQAVERRKEPLQATGEWEVPERVTHSENYRLVKAPKSVMQPFYASDKQSGPEKEFIELLEGHEKVEWWYKNGERESMYFAVPYEAVDGEKPFYVDFVVRFVDGRVGLFDTKQGFTIAGAPDKSDGLLAYIKKENKRRGADEKLVGGIVTQVADGGLWKIYRDKGCKLNSANLDNWDALDW